MRCKKVLTPPRHGKLLSFISYQGQALGYEDRDKNWKENYFIFKFDEVDHATCCYSIFGKKKWMLLKRKTVEYEIDTP
jgi:hypothetical protein